MNKLYSDFSNEEISPSKMKIKATLDTSILKETEDKILEDKTKNMVMPGFRKGEAPKELVAKHIGEENIKAEAMRTLAAKAFAQIVADNDLKVIGTPNINIEESDPVKIEAEASILPEIELPDYKEIAKKHNNQESPEIKVDENDVKEVVKHLRKEKAKILALQKGENRPEVISKIESLPESEFPELDEKDFKELAGVDTEEEFLKKVKEQIKTEREISAKEAKRAAILEEIANESKIEVPEELVDLEVQRSLDILSQDLAHMGMDMNSYLQQIGKSLEQLKEEMREPARKRVIVQLALDKIAQSENISVPEEELNKEVEHLKKHYPNANTDDLKTFVEAQKRNQAVLNFLESTK